MDFLDDVAPAAAVKAAVVIRDAVLSLAQYPERGGRLPNGLRRLVIPFGQAGYVAHYRRDREDVVVARILHMREDR